jgi:uncharacterized protein (DUF924 family)
MLKSYHWIQHVPKANLRAGGLIMNTRDSILALTLASTAALGNSVAQDARPAETLSAKASPAPNTRRAVAAQPQDVIEFWKQAGPALWFAKNPEFDRRFRVRYRALYDSAAHGELAEWQRTPEGALALVLLLDQYPRNSFRNTPRMYATDELARKVADAAIAAGYVQQAPRELQKFFVLPFAHSEDLADQERAVSLARRIGPDDLAHAEHHRDIVKRFGRFPHRNKILGRESTPEEQHYLDNGGYAG